MPTYDQTWLSPPLINTFTYKGFGLEAMFRYSGGNKILNRTAQAVLYNQKFKNNGTGILNRWTPENTVTDVPKLWYGSEGFLNLTSYAYTRFMESGDYLRLQNLRVSYTIPPTQLRRLTKENLSSLLVFVQAQNVFTWTKYSGFDPDNISESGLDSNAVPPIRTISLGLNVGF